MDESRLHSQLMLRMKNEMLQPVQKSCDNAIEQNSNDKSNNTIPEVGG